jgi:hypothetical protein
VHGQWKAGVAHICRDDNPRKRLLRLNPANSLFVAIGGRDAVTIRIDLQPQ